MASGKMNARQKMINMMYLVLTAMLAINVAKEVLDAFVVINMGLLQQKESLEQKNETVINDFSNQLLIDPANKRLAFLNEQALYIKQVSDKLTLEIEQMKVDLVKKVDGVDESKAREVIVDPMKADRKDDYDGPTHFFGTDKAPGNSGKANELKKKLESYRRECMVIVDKVLADSVYSQNRRTIRNEIEQKLNILLTNDPKDSKQYPTWEMQYFYHLPLSAALTELTKWENFVRGAEGDMLAFLWEEISRNAFKFDKIKVAVIPKSNFVTSGSNFEADVFLAAYSTNGGNSPVITYGSGVNETTLQVDGGTVLEKDRFVDGVGKISIPASGSGERTFAGTYQMKDPSGNVKTLPFSTTYNVAPPSATIEHTQLNVVYFGVDNPFTIAVPGAAPNQLVVSTNGGTLTGSNGNYVINPKNSTGKISVSVGIRTADGNIQRMGAKEFRVKKVPNPVIKFCGQESNTNVSKTRAANSPIIPDMSDFLFPVYAKVISVKGAIKRSDTGYQNFNFTGNVFPTNVSNMIKTAPNGSKLYLDEIKVSVPGGNRNLNAVYTLVN